MSPPPKQEHPITLPATRRASMIGVVKEESKVQGNESRPCVWLAVAVTAVLWFGQGARAQSQFELSDGQWVEQNIPEPGSAEAVMLDARKLIAQEKPDDAQDLLIPWIESNPNHPLIVEARLLLADAKTADQDYYKALFEYEAVIRLYPQTEQYHIALEREFEIARLFIEGTKRKLWGMRFVPADGEGEELLIRIQERVPGSELGERASLLLGDYYFEEGEMSMATDAYDLFLINYPRSDQREWAMLRLIQASLARFRGPGFDKTGLLDAQARLFMYQEEYPAAAERIGADALLARIEESLARHANISAAWYERRKEWVSAAYTYRRVIKDFPTTSAAQEALERYNALSERIDLSGLPDLHLFDGNFEDSGELGPIRETESPSE